MTNNVVSIHTHIRNRLRVLHVSLQDIDRVLSYFSSENVVYQDQCSSTRKTLTSIREQLVALADAIPEESMHGPMLISSFYMTMLIDELLLQLTAYQRLTRTTHEAEHAAQMQSLLAKELGEVRSVYGKLLHEGTSVSTRDEGGFSGDTKKVAWIEQVSTCLETLLLYVPRVEEVRDQFHFFHILRPAYCTMVTRLLVNVQTTGSLFRSLVHSDENLSRGHNLLLGATSDQFVSKVKVLSLAVATFAPKCENVSASILKERQDIQTRLDALLEHMKLMQQQFQDLVKAVGVVQQEPSSHSATILQFPVPPQTVQMPSPTFQGCTRCGTENRGIARFCIGCGTALSPLPRAPQGNAFDAQEGVIDTLPTHSLLYQRYRILEIRGRGGFGAVYMAADTKFADRIVAIKELLPQHPLTDTNAQQKAKEAFHKEALLLAPLSHPHLPRIYDSFFENTRSYIVMDFIDGKTLTEVMEDFEHGKRLPIEDAFALALQLCDVLDYLHSHNPPIIFRDLKPSNIMVTVNGHLYLVDFGIARLFRVGQKRDTEAFGSWGFAAPEQYGNKGQTHAASDIYSLGAVLHCMLTGIDPAQSVNPFLFPSVVDVRLPMTAKIQQMLETMLHIDASRRPKTVKDVRREIERLLSA